MVAVIVVMSMSVVVCRNVKPLLTDNEVWIDGSSTSIYVVGTQVNYEIGEGAGLASPKLSGSASQ